MNKIAFFIELCVSFLLLSQPAYARPDDMFDNLRMTNKRPWVPSDARRGQEMIKEAPNYLGDKSDIFRSVRLIPISVNVDMVGIQRHSTRHNKIRLDKGMK